MKKYGEKFLMIKKKEKDIVMILLGLSVVTALFNISIGIYFGVMTNVAVNWFKHYTKTYVD